ncbi:MAG: LTA synthase family protein [Proteobacteria bacterium]|nr:LTA synthase family protein [Pseudomonadota bacterium]
MTISKYTVARWRAITAAMRRLAMISAIFLPAAVLRVISVRDSGLRFIGADLFGLASDGIWAMGCGLLAMAVARLHRGIGAAVGVIAAVSCVVLHYANYESFRALGGPLNLNQVHLAADRTFFWGSAVHLHRPFLAVFLLALAAGLALWGTGVRWSKRGFTAGLAAIVLLAAVELWGPYQQADGWRRHHVVLLHWRSIVRLHEHRDDTPGYFPADRSGRAIASIPRPGHNVIVLIAEGVSGRTLVAEGSNRPPIMANLAGIAGRGLYYSNYINHQRATNRGMYSLLCGDLPKLLSHSPKMSELAGWDIDGVRCLPALLDERGYRTVYLQAAPLQFMSKDRFLPKAGFAEVRGREFFSKSYRSSAWGIDDRAFLQQSLAKVDELRAGNRPWLLTLLTVGTHHPYTVPHSHKSRYRRGSQAWAFDYLDTAIGEFVAALGDRGVLADTLLLITSDEAAGDPARRGSDVNAAVAQAWSPMVVLTPAGDSGRVEQVFMHIDTAISVLDYLGLADDRSPLGGRSMFRRYRDPRSAVFGNIVLRKIGALEPDGSVSLCSESFDACQTYRAGDDAFEFGLGVKPGVRRGLGPERIAWLRHMAARSLAHKARSPATSDLQLISAGDLPVASLPSPRVFGGQFLRLQAGVTVVVDIDIAVRGTRAVALKHFMWSPRGVIFEDRKLVQPGQVFRMHYAYQPKIELIGVTCNLQVVPSPADYPGDTVLAIRRAVLAFDRDAGDMPAGVKRLDH